MEPASLTTWLQPLQLRTQSIQSVWKCQVLFRILQTFKNLDLLFIGQMIKSQSEKCSAQNESNISVGVHVGSSLIEVKDTHLMNNNQPVAEILCWRLSGCTISDWLHALVALNIYTGQSWTARKQGRVHMSGPWIHRRENWVSLDLRGGASSKSWPMSDRKTGLSKSQWAFVKPVSRESYIIGW